MTGGVGAGGVGEGVTGASRRDLSSSQPSVIQASSPTVAISAGFVVDFTVIPA